MSPREGKNVSIELLDGKTLDGWEGYEDLRSVKDDVIVAKNIAPVKVSTYLLTKHKGNRLDPRPWRKRNDGQHHRAVDRESQRMRFNRGIPAQRRLAAGIIDASHSPAPSTLGTASMRMLLLFALACGLAASPAAAQNQAKKAPPKEAPIVPPREGKSETIQLFDGKTLDGWEGYEDLWSVKDGVIVAKNTAPVKVSTYLLTKHKYTDFRLVLEAKLVASEMHSGVCFWGMVKPDVSKQPEKDRTKYTYAGHLVMFPSGWGMYDLFGRNGLPVNGGPAKKVGKQHDWNKIEILAQGNRVRVGVNGTAVVDWRDPEPQRIKDAPIGLQLHANSVPQEIHFKGLVLETFPKEDKLITVK